MSSLSGAERRHGIADARAVVRIRLVGGKEGHIPLADLAALASGVQEAMLKIARFQEDRIGPGRTPDALKAAVSLEAVGIEAGSAVLVVEAPGVAEQQLALEGFEDDLGLGVLFALETLVEAVGTGLPMPDNVDPASEGIVRKMFSEMTSYESVEWTRRAGNETRTLLVRPQEIELPSSEEPEESEEASALVGWLYLLNLDSHSYGIEDDLGRKIRCEFPDDQLHLSEIRSLVGRRVAIQGVAFKGSSGRVERFVASEIAPAETPSEAAEFYAYDLVAALGSVKPISDMKELVIPDLTEREAEDFWRAITE